MVEETSKDDAFCKKCKNYKEPICKFMKEDYHPFYCGTLDQRETAELYGRMGNGQDYVKCDRFENLDDLNLFDFNF